jgi:hypothetical protein
MRFLNRPRRVLERAFRGNVPGIGKLTPQRPVDNRTGDIEKRSGAEGKCQNAAR